MCNFAAANSYQLFSMRLSVPLMSIKSKLENGARNLMAWAAAMSPSILCEVEAPVRMPTWNGLPASCSATALLESSRKVALGTPFGVKPLNPIVS